MRGIILPLLAFALAEASVVNRPNLYTPLKHDEHPCIAENLKDSHRYICDDKLNVICLSGWKWPDDKGFHDLRNPCPEPVCSYNNVTCQHGECVRPNVCACKVGWEGHLCDICVPLPGCDHGTCKEAFQCNCDLDDDGKTPRWKGAFCNVPACHKDCNLEHATCFEPMGCTCNEGWTGPNCDICKPLPGCVHGSCENGNVPNTCMCEPNWKGPLCDEPRCREGCHDEHGYCKEPETCLCKLGYQGMNCTECVPYWDCPEGGTCNQPNQCICGPDVKDANGYCNRRSINGF